MSDDHLLRSRNKDLRIKIDSILDEKKATSAQRIAIDKITAKHVATLEDAHRNLLERKEKLIDMGLATKEDFKRYD